MTKFISQISMEYIPILQSQSCNFGIYEVDKSKNPNVKPMFEYLMAYKIC